MLNFLLEGVEPELHAATRKATLSLGGVACLVVGVGFLVTALWLGLAELRDPLFASFVCGVAFVGAGLVIFAIARAKQRQHERERRAAMKARTESASEWVQLVEAFLQGVAAGRK